MAQWKNIYCSCAPKYWFSRAAKNVPMGLIRKLQFFVKIELSFSALDLLCYWEESNETLYRGRIYIVVVHLGIGFLARRKMSPMGLIRFSALDLPYYWDICTLEKMLSSGLKCTCRIWSNDFNKYFSDHFLVWLSTK